MLWTVNILALKLPIRIQRSADQDWLTQRRFLYFTRSSWSGIPAVFYGHFPQVTIHVHSPVGRRFGMNHPFLDRRYHPPRPFEIVVSSVRSDWLVYAEPHTLAIVRTRAGKPRHIVVLLWFLASKTHSDVSVNKKPFVRGRISTLECVTLRNNDPNNQDRWLPNRRLGRCRVVSDNKQQRIEYVLLEKVSFKSNL